MKLPKWEMEMGGPYALESKELHETNLILAELLPKTSITLHRTSLHCSMTLLQSARNEKALASNFPVQPSSQLYHLK